MARILQPVFLVGSQRSGTSMLANLLGRHPELFFTNEMKVGPFLYRQEAELQRFLAPYLEAPADDCFAHLAAEQLASLMQALLRPSGKTLWGDKFPEYSVQIPRLRRYFPRCRILHIVRDGRDVACSMIRQKQKLPHWNQSRWAAATWYGAAKKWHRFVSKALEDGRALPPDEYLELRFEGLVAHPEATFRSIFGFIGCSYPPSFQEELDRIVDRSGTHLREMDRDALELWHAFGPASRLLHDLGYPATPQEMPALCSASPGR